MGEATVSPVELRAELSRIEQLETEVEKVTKIIEIFTRMFDLKADKTQLTALQNQITDNHQYSIKTSTRLDQALEIVTERLAQLEKAAQADPSTYAYASMHI